MSSNRAICSTTTCSTTTCRRSTPSAIPSSSSTTRASIAGYTGTDRRYRPQRARLPTARGMGLRSRRLREDAPHRLRHPRPGSRYGCQRRPRLHVFSPFTGFSAGHPSCGGMDEITVAMISAHNDRHIEESADASPAGSSRSRSCHCVTAARGRGNRTSHRQGLPLDHHARTAAYRWSAQLSRHRLPGPGVPGALR